jgi:O-antigen ligase
MLFRLSGVCLLTALIFGGGTHSGFLVDSAVQLIAIPLLAISFWPALENDHPGRQKARVAVALFFICAAVVFLQVAPLPFDVWSGGAAFLSAPTPPGLASRPAWTSLTLSHEATWAAAASLIVPLAIFASVMQLDFKQRAALMWMMLGFGALSLLLGFAQMAQGPASSLRFYEETNPTEAVGFFANRNHFASLLNVALVLAGLWFAASLQATLAKGASKTRSILWFFAASAFFAAIAAGLVMARSRAGVIIAIAALAGIVALMFTQGKRDGREKALKARTVAIVVFAIVFAVQAGLVGLLSRFQGDFLDDLRFSLARTTYDAIPKALPFGTGLGTFVPVYAAVEDNKDAISSFANRAHNDVLEILLETGLLGAILGVAFLVWFGSRTVAIWRRPSALGHERQALFERAATLIIALLLFHSLVDYPLRTTALAAVFAFFSAFLAAPMSPVALQAPQESAGRRRMSAAKESSPAIGKPAPDFEWPEGWRR